MLEYQDEANDEVEKEIESFTSQAELVVARWEFEVALGRRKYKLSGQATVEIKAVQNRNRRKNYCLEVIRKAREEIKARDRAAYELRYVGTKPDNKWHFKRALRAYVSIRPVILARHGGLSREVAVKILDATRETVSKQRARKVPRTEHELFHSEWSKRWSSLTNEPKAETNAERIRDDKRYLTGLIRSELRGWKARPGGLFSYPERSIGTWSTRANDNRKVPLCITTDPIRLAERNKRAVRHEFRQLMKEQAPHVTVLAELDQLRLFRERIHVTQREDSEDGDWGELQGERPIRREHLSPDTLERQYFEEAFSEGYAFGSLDDRTHRKLAGLRSKAEPHAPLSVEELSSRRGQSDDAIRDAGLHGDLMVGAPRPGDVRLSRWSGRRWWSGVENINAGKKKSDWYSVRRLPISE